MARADVLAAVALRPTYAALPQGLLESAVEEAESAFRDYAGREAPQEALSVLVDLACIRLSMLGAEGSSSASEGGISRTWDALPQNLRDRMDRYRRPFL